jgi:hypothetical protein
MQDIYLVNLYARKVLVPFQIYTSLLHMHNLEWLFMFVCVGSRLVLSTNIVVFSFNSFDQKLI